MTSFFKDHKKLILMLGLFVVTMLIGLLVSSQLHTSNDRGMENIEDELTSDTKQRSLEERQGEHISVTDRGFLYQAPNQQNILTFYYDFDCESCITIYNQILENSDNWLHNGTSIEFVPLNYKNDGNSISLTNALVLIADKYPEKFFEIQRSFFESPQAYDIEKNISSNGVELTNDDKGAIINLLYKDWIDNVTSKAGKDVDFIPEVRLNNTVLEYETISEIVPTVNKMLNE